MPIAKTPPAKAPKSPKPATAAPAEPAPPAPDAKFKLKCGQTVTVYVDPQARTLPEAADVKLSHPATDEPGPEGLERWWVKFPTAPGLYRRYIMPLDAPAAVATSPEAAS